MDFQQKSNEKQTNVDNDINNDVSRTSIALTNDVTAHDAIDASLR